jgi:hypothetical protein
MRGNRREQKSSSRTRMTQDLSVNRPAEENYCNSLMLPVRSLGEEQHR